MDFVGQQKAENLLIRLLIAFGALGFLVGYVLQDFSVMVYINGAGLALTLLAVVPDWPFYNTNPLNWLPPLNPGQSSTTAAAAAAAKSK